MAWSKSGNIRGATGASGSTGATGSAGAAATVAVGTVTTGAVGSTASVSNSGSSSAAVLDFSIPRGATGSTGDVGPAGTTTWSGITDKPAVIAAGSDAAGARNVISAEYTGNKGAANGYASLDSSGLVPSSQLPSFVDDVVEAVNLASFPGTGEAGKIYTALDTNKVYRWGGSSYVEISASPGSTDAVPEGSTNLYYTAARADGRITAAIGSSVQAYSATLTTYAGKSAPSGAVVGTTDSQALTNKDLTGTGNTFPTFNQSTTGSAATLTTSRTIQTALGSTASASFDGSANISPGVSGTLAVTNGGTGVTSLTGLVKGNGTAAFVGATAGTDYVAPGGALGTPSSGTLTNCTFPTLNQNTTGSAATLTTGRTVQTNLASTSTATFDGSANITPGVTGTLPVANGGTGVTTITGLVKASGTAAFVGATAGTDYIAPGGALGTPSSGTLTSCSGLPVSGITASTSTALGVGSVELGHATDTTVARSSAGVISVEGVVIPSISSTNTLTNKRITLRTGTTTSSATPTINTDNVDVYTITALAADITSMTTNLSGTANTGDRLLIGFKDNGTARAITWGASFKSSGVATLLATTVISKQHWVGLLYDGSAWVCMAVDAVGY